MKPEPNPPRLINNPEFGEMLKGVATRRWNPERLTQNADVIQAKVAGLAAMGTATTGTVAAIRGPTIAKVAVPLALAISGGTAVVLWDSTPPEPPTSSAVIQESTNPPDQIEEPGPEPAKQPQDETQTRPRRKKAVSKPKPTSSLPEQLRLFERAKAAASRGDPARALRALDLLDARYPETTLRGEILLARAEYLSQSDDDDAAIRFIESILDQPVVTAKKAQLLRLVADIWLRRGICERAVPAYQRALGLGLNRADASSARAGLKKCTRR